MKSLTVLAFLVSATALAAPGFAGDSELATLSEPTISGPAGQVEPRQPLEDTTPTTTLAKPTYFSTVEIERIREAVRGQIQALASRDADAAFGYLAPSAQDYYTTPRAFLGTLARDMAPVMTAQRFALAEVERDSTNAVQLVHLTSADGARWLARFTVERQSDGAWAVKRCLVESAASEPRV